MQFENQAPEVIRGPSQYKDAIMPVQRAPIVKARRSEDRLTFTMGITIIWTNADTIHWHIYAEFGGYELTVIG